MYRFLYKQDWNFFCSFAKLENYDFQCIEELFLSKVFHSLLLLLLLLLFIVEGERKLGSWFRIYIFRVWLTSATKVTNITPSPYRNKGD